MDKRSRELERQAAQGGPQEQARLLRERMRRGLLEERRVEMAAYLDDEASQLIAPCTLHEPGCVLISPPTYGRRIGDGRYVVACPRCHPNPPFESWVGGLSRVGAQSEEVECEGLAHVAEVRWDKDCRVCKGIGKVKRHVPDREFLMRCALAAARHAIPAWEEQARNKDHEEHCPWGLVRSSDPGCGCPPRQNARLAVGVAEGQVHSPCGMYKEACYATMLTLGVWGRDRVFWALLDLLGSRAPESTSRGVVQAAAQFATPKEIQDAIQAEVVPWLLGD